MEDLKPLSPTSKPIEIRSSNKVTSLAFNQVFLDALKQVENDPKAAERRGTYKNVQGEWKWFTDKSPEGGLPTLAYGHKITIDEWSTKRVTLLDPNTNQNTTRDFRYGLSDAQVEQLLKQDVQAKEAIAERDWNHYQGNNASTGLADPARQWISLKDGYRMLLVDKQFNTKKGLVHEGKWIWTSLAQHMLDKDDTGVVLNSVATWTDTEGVKHRLTERAKVICKAAGLPYQVLDEA